MTDLVKSVSIENLVAQRCSIASKIRDAHKALQEAKDLAEALNVQLAQCSTLSVYDRVDIERSCFEHNDRRNLASDEGADKAVQEVDRVLWAYLMDASGMKTLMDQQARREWHEQLRREEPPPLTAENIRTTFGMMRDGQDEMFERGVLNVFRKLSWNYKSNSPVKFGKRVIMNHACRFNYQGKLWLEYEARNELADLERVLAVLDDQPERDHRDQFPQEINRAEDNVFPYFKIRGFKKGTAHVLFTRDDLVERMNKILTKHYPNALPAAV